MESKACAKFVRIGPKKTRILADEIRGKSVDECLFLLATLKNKQKSAEIIEKILKSAVANFVQKNENADVESLFVKKIFVDGGPTLKRIRARAQGRAARILKRTSHINIVVSN